MVVARVFAVIAARGHEPLAVARHIGCFTDKMRENYVRVP